MKTPITRFRDIPPLTRTGSYTVNVSWAYLESHLKSLAEGAVLDLDPDFQRKMVWDEERQRRYVEYVLRGGKSSRILHFNCSRWMRGNEGSIELVDGKQRLEAVRKFMRSEIKAFGSFFKDFTDSLRMVGPDFVFNINDLETRAETLQWYIDLNDSGVSHTEEEIEKVKKLLKIELAAK